MHRPPSHRRAGTTRGSIQEQSRDSEVALDVLAIPKSSIRDRGRRENSHRRKMTLKTFNMTPENKAGLLGTRSSPRGAGG